MTVLRQTEAWLAARKARLGTRQPENAPNGARMRQSLTARHAKAGNAATVPSGKPKSIPKAKATRQIPTEHQEQAATVAWWNLWGPAHGYDARLLFAVPNAGGFRGGFKSNAGMVAKLRDEGVRPGVPDLMLAITTLDSQRVPYAAAGLFLEMKRHKGKPTPEQAAYHDLLRGQGYVVIVCPGFEPARAAIVSYLG